MGGGNPLDRIRRKREPKRLFYSDEPVQFPTYETGAADHVS